MEEGARPWGSSARGWEVVPSGLEVDVDRVVLAPANRGVQAGTDTVVTRLVADDNYRGLVTVTIAAVN